ncbi:DHA2 family efflux MFS transporter permease subunit [Acinetobacter puyangensis]|uniref:Major Facilitator Superfamily protein n=1 Tax=Acinetobacter puyangensis TaxID=1096779 RepID=A0A240EAR6_9GAMM|nr:MFS transporter [Acinetobacter puyangensis]SNX45762.1 Major Facilitator Superfamily protein [Acinetobacter puyangensis]
MFNTQNYPKIKAMAIAAFGALLVGVFPLAISFMQADISSSFAVDANEITWFVSLYNLGQILGIPFAFFIAGVVGRRRAMLLAGGGFSFVSFLIALSSSFQFVLVLRLIQGFFGTMFPIFVFILIFSLLSAGAERTKGLAVFAAASSVGAGLAAFVGYSLFIAENWRFTFYCLGFLSCIYCYFANKTFLADPINLSNLKKIDWFGYLIISIALVSFIIAMSEGEKNFWSETWWITALLITSCIFIFLSFFYFKTNKAGLIRLSIFSKPFTPAILLQYLFRLATLISVWIIPQYMVKILGYKIDQLSYAILPLSFGTIIGIVFAFWSSPRIDQRYILFISFLMFGAVAWYCSYLTEDWNYLQFFWPIFFAGLAQGMFGMSTLHYALGNLDKFEGPTCGIIFNYVRVLGETSGIAIFSHLINERIKFHTIVLNQHLTAINSEKLGSLNRHFQSNTDTSALSTQVSEQAYLLSYIDALTFIALVLFIGSLFTWVFRAYKSTTE